ncbi:MAG: hypothetical protein QXL91_04735, partial [Candidatus Bathyarchaeia archaeon]
MSEQITVVAPRLSAEDSFLMRALRLANSRAPKARLIVTIAGKPSGTTEIAKAIDDMNESINALTTKPSAKTSRTK